eukprot:879521-Rhodomonas_salina.7
MAYQRGSYGPFLPRARELTRSGWYCPRYLLRRTFIPGRVMATRKLVLMRRSVVPGSGSPPIRGAGPPSKNDITPPKIIEKNFPFCGGNASIYGDVAAIYGGKACCFACGADAHTVCWRRLCRLRHRTPLHRRTETRRLTLYHREETHMPLRRREETRQRPLKST